MEEKKPTKKISKKTLVVIGIIMVAIVAAYYIVENSRACQVENCEYISLKAEDSSKQSEYCATHTCREDGCLNQKNSTATYCNKHVNNHTCECRNECKEKALKGYSFCKTHKCKYDGCNEEIWGNDLKKGITICYKHHCEICDAITEGDNEMCSKHMGYEKCLSCDEYKPDVELRTFFDGTTEDYKGEDYDWCLECWEDYKELSPFD